MAQVQHTPTRDSLEEAITLLFCLIDDDAYAPLNPEGRAYGSLKKLSDSEVLTLALFGKEIAAGASAKFRTLSSAYRRYVRHGRLVVDHVAGSVLVF